MQFEYATLVAGIVGTNELLKRLGLPSRYIPVVSLALGIVVSHFFVGAETLHETIFLGIVFGLASNGLFDVTKVFRSRL